MMKKLIPLLAALLLLPGCAAGSAAVPAGPLWTKEGTPVSVDYDRMWVYSASARSEDPAVLAALREAVSALEVGPESEWVTEDYTDILTFTFDDGDTLRLEFENQSVVMEDRTRYEVEGLGRLRAILDELIGENE